MSCPNLIEDGNKNEEVSTSVMNHHQDLIIDNKAKKEKTKSRISYFTIIASFSLLLMLSYVWLRPFMKAVTAGSESTVIGRFGSKIIQGALIAGITDPSNEDEAAITPKGTDPSKKGDEELQSNQPFCKKTEGKPPSLDAFDCSVFQSIKEIFYERVNGVIESNDEIALSDIYAQPLRLVFHDAGEVDLTNPHDSMGSDGCLSADPESKGLLEAESLVNSLLDPIWQKYCDSISRADFWVLIGKLVVEKAALPDGLINIPYQYGRKDNLECSAGKGRLPSAQLGFEGENGIIQVFVKRMGLTLDDAVTLSGAHTLGHVHLKNSGYSVQEPPESIIVNAWDRSPAKFDSLYFKYLLDILWTAERPDVMTDTTKNLWQAEDPQVPSEIMLNSDMSLAYSIFGEDEPNHPYGTDPNTNTLGSHKCSRNIVPENARGCINPLNPMLPSTFDLVKTYADNNDAFLEGFSQAYVKMTTVGYGLTPDNEGKFGSLTPMQCGK